jgi:peptidyl-prolyl cis-trans isomerase C
MAHKVGTPAHDPAGQRAAVSIDDKGGDTLFGDTGPRRRLPLMVLAFLPLANLLLAVLPLGANAQTPMRAPIFGLPSPNIKADASLMAAVAELDRSAGTIVAEVGAGTITWGDVADAIRAMPAIVSAIPFQQLYQNAALQVIEQKALALSGERAGLDKDAVVQRRLKNAADQAMAGEVLRRSLVPNITNTALHAIYDGVVAGKAGPDEVRGRLILVNTKAEAATLIQRLQEGADFSVLARNFSLDGTASNGGDLGFARLDALEPEIGSIMFALAPGQATSFPVRSGNFWFILKVESRRQPAAPKFEDARAALEQDVIHAGMPELMRAALQTTTVKYHGLTGRKADD